MMLKITSYIFRQLGLTTLFLTIILTAAVWLTQSLQFVDGVLNKGLPLRTFLLLIATLIPDLITIVLPAALLMAVIYTYNRLIADQELAVMRSAGMSDWQLAKPAVLVALLVTFSLYMTNIYILPNSYQKMRDIENHMQNSISMAMLQEGEFNSLKGLMVYIRKRENKKDMRGILIYNNRDKDQPYMITAESGSYIKSDDSTKIILLNGVRQDIDKNTNNPSMLYFDQYMVNLEPNKSASAARRKRVHEYTVSELLNPTAEMLATQKMGRFKSQGHNRVLSPLLALTYALISLAVMLHGQINRRHRTKKVMTIVALACALQLFTLVFINMSEHYASAIIFGYLLIFLTVAVSLAQINHWFGLKPLAGQIRLQERSA